MVVLMAPPCGHSLASREERTSWASCLLLRSTASSAALLAPSAAVAVAVEGEKEQEEGKDEREEVVVGMAVVMVAVVMVAVVVVAPWNARRGGLAKPTMRVAAAEFRRRSSERRASWALPWLLRASC